MTTDPARANLSTIELRAIELAAKACPGSPAPELDLAIEKLREAGSPFALLFDAIRLDSGHLDVWPSHQEPTLFECKPQWQDVLHHPGVRSLMFAAPFGNSNFTLDSPALDRYVTHDGDNHYTALRARLAPNLLLELRDHEWVDNMQCEMDMRGTLFEAHD